jgi:Tfp pilus assembly protein PilF
MKRRPVGHLLAVLSLALLTALASPTFAKGKNPDTKDAQLSFGIRMARRGLWSEALFRFQQAERLEPGNAKVLNNVAVAYEALGQFELALDYYRRAIQAAPSNADMKRNYSRFVEFYRAFKATVGDAEEDDGPADTDEDDGPRDADEEGGP